MRVPPVTEDDPHDLDRFVRAQLGTYDRALAEIKAGEKVSHWMWFVFPQFAGLGFSPTARAFAIKSLGEARAYLAHPILGPRLVEAAGAVMGVEGRSALDIFDTPDDLKLRSSATLFAAVSPAGSLFHRVLDKYYDGRADLRTLELLRVAGEP